MASGGEVMPIRKRAGETLYRGDQCGTMLRGLRAHGQFEKISSGTVEVGGQTKPGRGRGLLSTALPQ